LTKLNFHLGLLGYIGRNKNHRVFGLNANVAFIFARIAVIVTGIDIALIIVVDVIANDGDGRG
jgi:hypothetical protein